MIKCATGVVLALCIAICSGAVHHPSHTWQHPAFRASVSAEEPSMAMLMTGSAGYAENPVGDAAKSHAANYGMILAIVVIGGCLCCVLVGVGGAVAVGTVVYAIVSQPTFKLCVEQSKRQEELPDEVKVHVNSMEFRDWSKNKYEDYKNKGMTLSDVVKEIFGEELANDEFFVKTFKSDKATEWSEFALVNVLRYFETIQFINQKKISLTKLGVKLPPKPVSVKKVQEMRLVAQSDLPEDIQKHINSMEFLEFSMKYFTDEYQEAPLDFQCISMESVAKAVQKAFPANELIEDCASLQKQLKDDKCMDFDAFKEVFMYLECLLYKKMKMLSLKKKGTTVPVGFKPMQKGEGPRIVEQAPSATPAIQDA